MKNVKPALLAASCALLAAVGLPAQAGHVGINDVMGHGDGTYYMGADDQGYGDVIGSLGNFSIEGMNVSRTGNTLNVSIVANFAGKGDDCLFGGTACTGTPGGTLGLTNGLGIGYGDLFLASTWAPSGTEPYQFDDNSNGTIWEYGFSLNDRWSGTGNNLGGTLYSLDSDNNNDDALLSDNFLSGTFRNGQEVAVDINNVGGSASVTAVTGNSNWSVDNSTIDFSIDLTGTTLANSNSTFALHWAMTCANDTIEGEATLPQSVVPVPAAVWLFGSGLVGLVSIARRRQRS